MKMLTMEEAKKHFDETMDELVRVQGKTIADGDPIALASLAGIMCSMLGAYKANDIQRFFKMSIAYSTQALKEITGDVVQH